jgi:DNA-binding LacI/PurR family transcriptional regulator
MIKNTVKKVTLKDIAKEAGIGAASVSKALRGSKDISMLTIEKVKKIADEMGYYPNITARSLVSNKNHTIGVLLPEIKTSYHSHVIEGMNKMARSRGYQIILMVSDESSENEKQSLRYLASLPVDAIIATVSDETTDFTAFEQINERGTPVVFFGRNVKNSQVVTYGADDYFWASKIMDFFLSEGRRKIAFLGPRERLFSSEQKYKAYTDLLKKAGIKRSMDLVKTCKIDDEDGYLKTKEMLSQGAKPDAMLCANDMVAIGAAKALTELGLGIPNEVALAGFGNLIETTILNVPISTVDFYPEKMGRKVVDQLIDRMEFNKQPHELRNIEMEASLIIRK